MTGLGLPADVAANTSRIVDILEGLSDEEDGRGLNARRSSNGSERRAS